MGEVDRGRGIFVHASSLANPETDREFWDKWNEFEATYGNEDTFKEMLRIRRSVLASFSQTHFNTGLISSIAQPPSSGNITHQVFQDIHSTRQIIVQGENAWCVCGIRQCQ